MENEGSAVVDMWSLGVHGFVTILHICRFIAYKT
jgi:hypothetical protein